MPVTNKLDMTVGKRGRYTPLKRRGALFKIDKKKSDSQNKLLFSKGEYRGGHENTFHGGPKLSKKKFIGGRRRLLTT